MSLEILKKYKIKAKKSLWQNFLVNDEIVEEIADTIDVEWKNIVEVGPGYWALTEKLITRKPKSLNLVELDIDMIEILENRIENGDFDIGEIDFHINNIDVLKYAPIPTPISNIVEETEYKYSVIANIPYYITSPILRHFLYDLKIKPQNMVILMQKDVADKILLGQDFWMENEELKSPLIRGYPMGGALVNKNKKMKSSVLSLFVAKKCYVDEVILVWKQNFIPAPKVESSVLLFEMHDLYKNVDDYNFLELIKKWFREPRKMLMRNLLNAWYDKNLIIQCFDELLIDHNIRWEDLNIYIWC